MMSLLAFGFLAGLVILIYDMKFETRRLENKAQQLTRAIEDEKDNVALMRAEWSHVARPEQIEKLAREHLQLEPVKSSQIVDYRDFLDVLARRPVPGSGPESAWQPRDDIGALIRGTGEGAADARRVSAQ
jgi:cell division protein FtsL